MIKNKPIVWTYNKLPMEKIGTKIFEVGSTDNIFHSKLKERIFNCEYWGLNIVMNHNRFILTSNYMWKFIKEDILDYEFEEKFDTIIMLEVLEHIHLRHWETIIEKLKNALTPNGKLFISVPSKQNLSDYLKYWNKSYWEIHCIFGIDKKALQYFFPDAKIKKIHFLLFNQDNKSFFWALGRIIKRLIQRQPYLYRPSWLIEESK
jgi:SAM-dependent methyltransferase